MLALCHCRCTCTRSGLYTACTLPPGSLIPSWRASRRSRWRRLRSESRPRRSSSLSLTKSATCDRRSVRCQSGTQTGQHWPGGTSVCSPGSQAGFGQDTNRQLFGGPASTGTATAATNAANAITTLTIPSHFAIFLVIEFSFNHGVSKRSSGGPFRRQLHGTSDPLLNVVVCACCFKTSIAHSLNARPPLHGGYASSDKLTIHFSWRRGGMRPDCRGAALHCRSEWWGNGARHPRRGRVAPAQRKFAGRTRHGSHWRVPPGGESAQRPALRLSPEKGIDAGRSVRENQPERNPKGLSIGNPFRAMKHSEVRSRGYPL